VAIIVESYPKVLATGLRIGPLGKYDTILHVTGQGDLASAIAKDRWATSAKRSMISSGSMIFQERLEVVYLMDPPLERS
jgi:hypothetical protein